MKLFSLNSLFLFLMIGSMISMKSVYAQEDAAEGEDVQDVVEEEEEGVVEDEDEGGEAEEEVEAVTTEDLEESDKISSHKDITTAILFQSGAEPAVVAGKKTKGFVHFSNGGSNNFIITTIEGSFRYPQDYSYVIQNFTSLGANKMIDAGKEGSFSYAFTPGELAGDRSFGLSILVNYKDVDGNLYQDAVYNQTVLVLENMDDVDTETFFMYLMLIGMGSLLFFGVYHMSGSKSKSKRSPAASAAANGGMEVGTDSGEVDYGWIPEDTLKAMHKTPSPRTTRKRGKKAAAAQASESE